jgi:uncharacterized protein YbaR (Trm112 family)
MAQVFRCPYCNGVLNVEDKIVFSVRTKNGVRGLIFLNPELGNYQTITNPSFKVKEGELNQYLCPICHANLAALEINQNLVKVLLTEENKRVYEILFSGIAGEHCTYKLKETELETYGEDSDKYQNFFGEGPRY